jgi:hypothetical protein
MFEQARRPPDAAEDPTKPVKMPKLKKAKRSGAAKKGKGAR